jgi:hypothetical protein
MRDLVSGDNLIPAIVIFLPFLLVIVGPVVGVTLAAT